MTLSHALARTVLLLAALSTSACLTLEQAAPLVETLNRQGTQSSPAQLALGRDIYITKCAKCHSVEPVHKYPEGEWVHKILPEMNEETKLNAEESAAVKAYILAVLKTPRTY